MSRLKEKLLNIFKSKNELDDGLETAQEKSERWTSIRIVYFTMFTVSLGFSIILTGGWPFLEKLDPTVTKEFLGIVVAANAFGQMLFSPLIGWWANKLGSIRLPMLSTLFIFVLSNIVYATVEVFEDNKKYWVLASRFFGGVSSANIVAACAYASSATKLKERTMAISFLNLVQVIGFIAGPALQCLFTTLGDEGIDIGCGLKLDMYTATGWINVLFGMINFVMYLPYFFKEHKIAAKEVMMQQGKTDEKDAFKFDKPDYVACWTLIFASFVMVFNYILLETLATPITMDQFAWTDEQSVKYMSLVMVVGGVVSTLVFVFTGKLSEIFSETKLLIWGSLVLMCLATLSLFSWGSEPPKLAIPSNYTIDALKDMTKHMNLSGIEFENFVKQLAADEGEKLVGCPVSQAWCEYVPKLIIPQLLLAYAFASIGYPLGMTLIQTIFSKILGPRPQGLWMGYLQGSGCFSRVMGPVFVSYVYSNYGPLCTFSITFSITLSTLILLKLVNKKLTPPDVTDWKKNTDAEMQDLVRNNENGDVAHIKNEY